MKGRLSTKMLPIMVVLALVALFACLGAWVFRDALSLVYWRARYLSLPRAVGSGPQEIFRASEDSNIRVNLVGISAEEWKVSHVWVPGMHTVEVTSTNDLIVTMGCWWDNSWRVTDLPVDSNGSFTEAMDRTVGLADAPLQNQIAFQVNPEPGQHVVTPPVIGARGDGFFMVLNLAGIDPETPVRDSGQSRDSHKMFGDNDPDTIQSITVSTDGALAQVGDLAVAVFSMDPCDNPDINISLPDGWVSIGHNDVALQNIGYRACCKIVTEPGRQSSTCSWTDDSTFVAEAAIVVFKAGGFETEGRGGVIPLSGTGEL